MNTGHDDPGWPDIASIALTWIPIVASQTIRRTQANGLAPTRNLREAT